MLMIEKRRW